MPRVEFEPTIPVFELAKMIHALDRMATVIEVEMLPSQITLCIVIRIIVSSGDSDIRRWGVHLSKYVQVNKYNTFVLRGLRVIFICTKYYRSVIETFTKTMRWNSPTNKENY
jgi:hypothetical protein